MDEEEALLVAIKVYYSLLVIVGLPANVLTLYILLQRCARSCEDRHASSLYLIALAIADSLVLITIVIIYQMIFSVVPPGEFCPYLNVLDYGAHNASIWIIVTYTIERFIGVYFPVWKYKVSNPSTAKIAISGVFLMSYLLALPHFFTVSSTTKEVLYGNLTTYRCDLKENLSVELRLGVIWGQSVLSYMLPFLFITILNGLIVCKLRRMRRVGPQRAWTFPGTSGMASSLSARGRTVERSQFNVNPKLERKHFRKSLKPLGKENLPERTRTGNGGKSRRQSRVTMRDQGQSRFRAYSPDWQDLPTIAERSHSEIILSQSEPGLQDEIHEHNQPCSSETNRKEAISDVKADKNLTPKSHSEILLSQSRPGLQDEIHNQPCSSQTNRKEAITNVKTDENLATNSPSQFQRFCRRSRSSLSENATPQGVTRSNGRPILILITVSAMFVLLWFPRFVIFLILRINDQNRFETFSHKLASEISTMLGVLNSSINMFLYSFVDSRFRSRVFGILSCGKKITQSNTSKSHARTEQQQSKNKR